MNPNRSKHIADRFAPVTEWSLKRDMIHSVTFLNSDMPLAVGAFKTPNISIPIALKQLNH